MTHFDLFLFDFDGLLVDTERLHYQAYVHMCARRGISLNWDYAQFCRIAHSNATAIKEALYQQFPELQTFEWETLYKEKKSAYMQLLEKGDVQFMPGARELLFRLEKKGIRAAVATHSPQEQIDQIKKHLPILNRIPYWITREDYTNPKPAPDAYLTAIAKASLPNDRIIGFEDSERGLRALQQTSALPVLIAPIRPENLAPNTLYFPSLIDYLCKN